MSPFGTWQGAPVRSGHTISLTATERRSNPCDDPPRALLHLPKGPMYDLARDFPTAWSHRWIYIGSDEQCCLRVEHDRKISAGHCVLGYDRRSGRLWGADTGSKNGTEIDGRPAPAFTEMHSGSILRVGNTVFLVCGKAGRRQKPRIPAEDIDDFLRGVLAVYGSQSLVSRILRIPRATLARWLATRKFATGSP